MDYFTLAKQLAEQLAAHGVFTTTIANSPSTKHTLVHRAVERQLATYTEQDLRSYCYDRMSEEFSELTVQELLAKEISDGK